MLYYVLLLVQQSLELTACEIYTGLYRELEIT